MNVSAGRGPRLLIRGGAFIALVGVAALALPAAAYTVEALSPRAENWVFVLQLALMAGAGALTGAVLARMGTRPAARSALAWGALGLVATVVADGVWVALVAG